VRLPVLAGSRIVFYISAESYHDDLPLPAPRDGARWDTARLASEMGVYRAQAQARAVENRVWLVKSNWAGDWDEPTSGSHGESCIVDPTGVVRCEAGVYDEAVLCHELDLGEATALYAHKSLLPEYALSGWWKDALARVTRVP
jgi:predicted amidohydrolase